LDGDATRSPSAEGLGIDLADPNTFEHLPPDAVERAACRWLSPAERAWCESQPSFRLAMVTVLSCKESVCKATGGATPVAEARLAMEGSWPRGWARATGPEPIALWWEVGSGHILTVGVRGPAHYAKPLLLRIVRGRGGNEAA
jgi:4'-phosphopantetheinyl transferase superfamily